MEKRKPTYQLTEVKRLATEGFFDFSIAAWETANALKFSEIDVRNVILRLESRDFYKSVSEYREHQVWQDVYKKQVGNSKIYIKFKIVKVEERFLLIMSFKKDESRDR